MQLSTRRLLDRSFTAVGIFSIMVMALFLIVLLGPIFWNGAKAFFFRETVEHREFLSNQFGRGDQEELQAELAAAEEARAPLFAALAELEAYVEDFKSRASITGSKAFTPEGRELRAALKKKGLNGSTVAGAWMDQYNEIEENVEKLLGPLPGAATPPVLFRRYGETRWDRMERWRQRILFSQEYVYASMTELGKQVDVPRIEKLTGLNGEPIPAAEKLFAIVSDDAQIESMLRPKFKFYWRFLFDESPDGFHYLGGIWAAVLGTLYLTVGAMIIAAPVGIISAIYLSEYAPDNWFVGIIRSCISTLAGVPSIVFGLFGLAFFIRSMGVSDGPSVLAGSMTLAVLVLPTVIRASEEAVKAVPHTYKEAALGLGASKWRTTFTVVLPAALPGVLTSIIISMGRAAGETAPIIFTAAVSLSSGALPITEVFNTGTEALPWSVYNMCSENIYAPELAHVQFGMVSTLIGMVLALNVIAIYMRARISSKLRG